MYTGEKSFVQSLTRIDRQTATIDSKDKLDASHLANPSPLLIGLPADVNFNTNKSHNGRTYRLIRKLQ